MKMIDQKCPNCGGTLEVDVGQGKAKCPYCKSQFMIKRTGERWVVDRQAVVQMAQQNEKNYKTIISILGFMVILIGLLFVFVFHRTEEPKPAVSIETVGLPEAYMPEEVEPVVEESEISENMKAILEMIFSKPYEKISSEEIGKIQYLSLSQDYSLTDDWSQYNVTYSFEDYFSYEDKDQYISQLTTIECDKKDESKDESTELKKSDFSLFTGLTYVDCNCMDEELLSEFKNIKGINVEVEDLKTLTEYVDPNKIIELKIGGRLKTLEGISRFSNLQFFSMSYTSVSDISELELCHSLKSLSLADNSELFDYKVISKLTELEALEINAEGIKNASFIEALPKLKKLGIDDMNINQLDFLEKQSGLTYLSLKNIDKVTDLTPIGSLAQLKTLILDVPTYDMDLSSLGKLSQLKKLNIYGAYGDVSFSFLKHLMGLQEVSISSANLYDGLGVLSNCPNLEKLTLGKINYGSLNFHKLAGLSKLKEINVAGYDFNADISSLFTLSQLETINLKESSFQADFSLLKDMVNLKELYLDHVKIYTNVYVESDGFCTSVWYDDLLLQDQIDKIANCKSLQTLTLSDNELNDISALGKLTELEILDISSNYIDDVSALEKCSKLQHVKAKDNLVEDWSPIAHINIDK